MAATGVRGTWNDPKRAERIGGIALLAAGVVVAGAIVAEGDVARRVNGVAGVLWFAAAALLLRAARQDPAFRARAALVIGVGLALALVVRPSDLLWAIAGFGVAGGAIAAVVGAHAALWARVLPALWLPLHLALAAGQGVLRVVRDEPAALRRDPPPTTALVPLAMIVAAWLAGVAVVRLRARRRGAAGVS